MNPGENEQLEAVQGELLKQATEILVEPTDFISRQRGAALEKFYGHLQESGVTLDDLSLADEEKRRIQSLFERWVDAQGSDTD